LFARRVFVEVNAAVGPEIRNLNPAGTKVKIIVIRIKIVKSRNEEYLVKWGRKYCG